MKQASSTGRRMRASRSFESYPRSSGFWGTTRCPRRTPWPSVWSGSEQSSGSRRRSRRSTPAWTLDVGAVGTWGAGANKRVPAAGVGCLDDFLGCVYALIFARHGGFADRVVPIESDKVVIRAQQISLGGCARTENGWSDFTSTVLSSASLLRTTV